MAATRVLAAGQGFCEDSRLLNAQLLWGEKLSQLSTFHQLGKVAEFNSAINAIAHLCSWWTESK
jgi:hypothetical protein